MISPAEADALIGEQLTCLPIESLPLVQCTGAVLRENVYAERDQPPFDRVAMDGIAVSSAALADGRRRFRVQAMQAAGDAPLTLTDRGHAIEIMTGAVLPAGCDAVVPVEQLQLHDGEVVLDDALRVSPWQNVHRRGSDSEQGKLLLAAGMHLGAPEIAVAAGAGMARIRVSAQPTIIVVSTGNELIEPGDPIEPHQVRRSNAYGIVTALRQRGFQRIADDHLPDELDTLRRRLRVHLDTHDVLILSGGVSMGKLDLVPQALADLGVREVFHKISQRPGKPMWFGIGPTGTAVFALPGNPVSTLVCLARYVVPGLYAAMGESPRPAERIAIAAPAEVKVGLTTFLPVQLQGDEWGRTWAHPRPTNGSGDFAALTGTDGFVELPPGPNVYPKGFVTRLHRW
ncbi:MAG: molybdopterin molybdotransferase MoeA [Gammaproteobacteria bacterium]|nr:molybdopterin molybdotransferase MoeA [Gammaproteobacteria bacterium]